MIEYIYRESENWMSSGGYLGSRKACHGSPEKSPGVDIPWGGMHSRMIETYCLDSRQSTPWDDIPGIIATLPMSVTVKFSTFHASRVQKLMGSRIIQR